MIEASTFPLIALGLVDLDGAESRLTRPCTLQGL
jgi:hypothetical protein